LTSLTCEALQARQVGGFPIAFSGTLGAALLRFRMRRFVCGLALRNQPRPLRRRHIAGIKEIRFAIFTFR
jgi:hypothetical protein